MSILKKIKDKTGTIHDLGDSRVDAFETELSGAEHNVPYSPAVLAKTNAIESGVSAHIGNTANPHKVTKAQIGLANVENKSSTQIRSELTKENVTNALGYTPIDESRIGAANGVASLDASGRIPASQIPGGFDNIEEYDNLAAFPTTGEEGKIYVAKDTNLTYRWTGSQYVEISPSLALGETATTAYRGDRGKVAYDHSQVSGNSTIHHTHANKELLDSYTQTEADLANAVAKVHEHGNKDVLDGITSSDVANWNSKQNSLTAGDNITIDSDTISSNQVFVATYGITKYAEVKAAYDAGKICTVRYTESYFYLTVINTELIWFVAPNPNPNIASLKLTIDNKWVYHSPWLQTHLTFDTEPKAGSKNPVTSDGIKTALNNYVGIYKGDSSNFHVKNNEYYSFICRTNISNWERIQADFFCPNSDSSTVGKFNIFATLSTSDTSLHTPERVAELGGIVWDYNYKGYNTIKYRIYVAKSGDNFYFYAKRNSSNDNSRTAFRSRLLYTTKTGLTDNVSADLDDATWQTLSLVEMKNVYSSTTQERLDSHKNDTTIHITAEERKAWNAKQSALTFDATPTAGSTNPVTSEGIKTALEVLQSNIDDVDAKGIVINEINGENVICFE